ncbi:MAG: cupin domain-containing protein [Minwuia sp.]|uniref:cupin domain-containing protein n=1 Tax=Minwuia sp. TaxID=2493630 RepID=UPI003A8B377D
MRVIRSTEFTAPEAWAALDIERIDDATVRLHWTDKPYVWHVNDGPEVFAVMDGEVDMHTRDGDNAESVTRLAAGDIFHAEAGDAHVAHPRGAARILVIERAGSI